MQKISFIKFNFKNGLIHLLTLFFGSLILLPITGNEIFEFKIWFIILLFLSIFMTYFNYRVWKKLK
jgi:hypothetical protein